jgi:para-aminobenzoate synthetase/4-amino-4-deoxychorismate lyase
MDKIKPQIKRIKELEVLLRDADGWLHFSNPYRLIISKDLDQVLPAMQEIERLVREKGWYAAGFLSYEAAPAFDPALVTFATPGFPYLWFGLYPQPRSVALPATRKSGEISDWRSTICRDAYDLAIAKIKEHIAEGRTYQVNYTMRLQANFMDDAWEYFLQLAQKQNHHAAYLDTGDYAICSASPELFFELDGKLVTCRPMKGTAPRGRTTFEDHQQSDWLRHSEKNRAENVMIVDMIRNDLGRIAETGTVLVPGLFDTERYPTLWQMTSTVSARTEASVTQILSALFPCASITGAPKVSTMKIIADLESTPRKIYTGTIGYIAPERRAKFSVAIRTVLIDRQSNTAEYGVGGGIVWDSTSADEYEEAWLKARVLTLPERTFSLLETMLWTPEEGFFLRQRHVARMLESADYSDIPIVRETLEEFLYDVSWGFREPQRVRVLLDQTGRLKVESKPLENQDAQRPLKARLADNPVDSGNVFLFHKTTAREAYDSALKDARGYDDVLLHNEKGELTEFTIGNLVLELADQLLTPPVSCGVLPGTFRAYLLDTRQIVERVLPIGVLDSCTRIFRVNSLRRWQEVEL